MSDRDQKRGLYRKYFVQRLKAEDRGRDLRLAYESARGAVIETTPPQKHETCRYYVLDLDHDKFAGPALRAYAAACAAEYPDLAADLLRLAPASPPPSPAGAAPFPPTAAAVDPLAGVKTFHSLPDTPEMRDLFGAAVTMLRAAPSPETATWAADPVAALQAVDEHTARTGAAPLTVPSGTRDEETTR